MERAPFDHLIKDWELSFIERFKRGALNYLETHEIPDNIMEWLALMQHYGAPTRMLDFSESPYIASFFAVEKDLSEDFAVWAVNTKSYKKETNDIIFEKFSHLENEEGTIPNNELILSLIKNNNIKVVLDLEPYRMNKRFRIQKGVFLCPGSTLIGFEENLELIKNQKENLKKIIINNGLRGEALSDLNQMNINRENLFLSLEGFSESLVSEFEVAITYSVEIEKHYKFYGDP